MVFTDKQKKAYEKIAIISLLSVFVMDSKGANGIGVEILVRLGYAVGQDGNHHRTYVQH